MFETFERARRSRRSRWIYGVLAAAVAIHGLLLIGFVAYGWWTVDKLALPSEGVALAVATPPPTPPPARKGSPEPAKPEATNDAPKVDRQAPDETTQPVTLEDPDDAAAGAGGGGAGVLGHPDGSDVGVSPTGCVGLCDHSLGETEIPTCRKDAGCCDRGDCCDESKCQDERVVPQNAVAKRFVSGERQPRPDDATRVQMARDDTRQIITTVKYCIDTRGAVNRLALLKSSGYRSYDRRILEAMRAWRYRPFEVNGEAKPVCSSIQFVYRMAK